jgi:hypothetical protein
MLPALLTAWKAKTDANPHWVDYPNEGSTEIRFCPFTGEPITVKYGFNREWTISIRNGRHDMKQMEGGGQ